MRADHGGGILGRRDEFGALRVAVLDGRVGVALDLVVRVHRGVVLLVEVQRNLAVALVDEDRLHVVVALVVVAHGRADGAGGIHCSTYERCVLRMLTKARGPQLAPSVTRRA